MKSESSDPGARRKRKPKALDSSDLAFRYFENLKGVLRDLQHLDSLIPKETSRLAYMLDGEACAIAIARKDDLLNLIQTMCRDHLLWGNKLLADGWEPTHKGKFAQKQDYRHWNYIG